MGKNSTGKYLKYAIGEIVLVVIGILIALQINNWNEKRKINSDIDRLFTALESELEGNILETSRLLNVGHSSDSIRTLYRENRVTREMILEKSYFAFGDYRTRSTFLEDERLDEVIDQEKEISSKYKSWLPDIKRLKRRIKAWRFWQSKTLDLSFERKKELASRTPWFNKGDSLAIEKIITRSLEDKIYRSEVEHYIGNQLGENVWEANLIRTTSVVLLWELKSAKNKSLKIENFLKSIDLQPFIEFTCFEIPEKTYETHFRRSVLIYNNQEKEATIKLRSKNDNSHSIYRIEPKSFLNLKYDAFISPNVYFEFEKNGQCFKVYDANKEDYIIL